MTGILSRKVDTEIEREMGEEGGGGGRKREMGKQGE